MVQVQITVTGDTVTALTQALDDRVAEFVGDSGGTAEVVQIGQATPLAEGVGKYRLTQVYEVRLPSDEQPTE